MRIPWPCSANSPNGEWKIEALADVKKVENFEFPPFTFRLSRLGIVLWENTELNRGDGPRKLFISDQGRVVLETYGDEYAVLLVLSPEGNETGKIIVSDLSGESRSRLPWGSRVVFDSLGRSTHSLPWSQYAVTYFLVWKGMEHLSFLFPSGQRFLVWLEAGIPVVNPSPDLIHECELLEQEWARSRLESVPAEDLSMELAIIVRHRCLNFYRMLDQSIRMYWQNSNSGHFLSHRKERHRF